jgi:hypothetical protein
MTPIFAALGSAVLAFIEKDVAGNLAKVPPATPPPLLVMLGASLRQITRDRWLRDVPSPLTWSVLSFRVISDPTCASFTSEMHRDVCCRGQSARES